MQFYYRARDTYDMATHYLDNYRCACVRMSVTGSPGAQRGVRCACVRMSVAGSPGQGAASLLTSHVITEGALRLRVISQGQEEQQVHNRLNSRILSWIISMVQGARQR